MKITKKQLRKIIKEEFLRETVYQLMARQNLSDEVKKGILALTYVDSSFWQLSEQERIQALSIAAKLVVPGGA
jgi:hypothetical protein